MRINNGHIEANTQHQLLLYSAVPMISNTDSNLYLQQKQLCEKGTEVSVKSPPLQGVPSTGNIKFGVMPAVVCAQTKVEVADSMCTHACRLVFVTVWQLLTYMMVQHQDCAVRTLVTNECIAHSRQLTGADCARVSESSSLQ
jgi:hypothetical protein